MNNTNLKWLAFLWLASLSIHLSAQTFAKRTSEVGTTLLVATSLKETAPLHFGTSVLTNAAGGHIVLPANTANLVYSGGIAKSAAMPTATNATFQVTGAALETYSISLPETVLVTHASAGPGAATMKINQFTARFHGASADALSSTLPASGADSFTIGCTLNVGTNQMPGVYAGTFQVTMEHN